MNGRSKPLVVIQCYEDRQQTLPLRKTEFEKPSDIKLKTAPPKRESSHAPPPPPPMPNLKPITNGHNGDLKQIDDINQSKPLHDDLNKTLSNRINGLKNGKLTRTPTPDYNEPVQTNGREDKADLESIESYKLKSPSSIQPRPPSHYFVKAPNGTATMKKLGRPVSVTIGEYGKVEGNRKEPSKLDFLNGDKVDGHAPDDSISNRLQSELALTLSRSNLRKKTEALADAGR